MTYLCVFVFICFYFISIGLERVLILFVIKFWMFRLIIHLFLSSELEVTKLLVHLSSLVFFLVYQVEFQAFGQSFIVVHMRKRVMVHNSKTDSNSEFKGRKTVEEREGYANERSEVERGHKGSFPWRRVATTCLHGVPIWQAFLGWPWPLHISTSLSLPFSFKYSLSLIF